MKCEYIKPHAQRDFIVSANYMGQNGTIRPAKFNLRSYNSATAKLDAMRIIRLRYALNDEPFDIFEIKEI